MLDNNGGTAYSGSEPTSESTSPFELGGYVLKYMYTITASNQTKFLTTDFMSAATDSINNNKLIIKVVFNITRDPNTLESVQVEIGDQ